MYKQPISLISAELKSNLLFNSVYNTSCFMDVSRKFVRQISGECFSGECQGRARKFLGEAVARVANFPAKNCRPAKSAAKRKEKRREGGKRRGVNREETAERRNENPPRGASNVRETRFARTGTTH